MPERKQCLPCLDAFHGKQVMKIDKKCRSQDNKEGHPEQVLKQQCEEYPFHRNSEAAKLGILLPGFM